MYVWLALNNFTGFLKQDAFIVVFPLDFFLDPLHCLVIFQVFSVIFSIIICCVYSCQFMWLLSLYENRYCVLREGNKQLVITFHMKCIFVLEVYQCLRHKKRLYRESKKKITQTSTWTYSIASSPFILVLIRTFRVCRSFTAGLADVRQEFVEAEWILLLLKLHWATAGTRGARTIGTTEFFIGNKPYVDKK